MRTQNVGNWLWVMLIGLAVIAAVAVAWGPK